MRNTLSIPLVVVAVSPLLAPAGCAVEDRVAENGLRPYPPSGKKTGTRNTISASRRIVSGVPIFR